MHTYLYPFIWACVCVYTCMHVCVHVYMHVCACLCIPVCEWCEWVCVHMCVWVGVCLCMCVCTCVRACMCVMCVCVCVCTCMNHCIDLYHLSAVQTPDSQEFHRFWGHVSFTSNPPLLAQGDAVSAMKIAVVICPERKLYILLNKKIFINNLQSVYKTVIGWLCWCCRLIGSLVKNVMSDFLVSAMLRPNVPSTPQCTCRADSFHSRLAVY